MALKARLNPPQLMSKLPAFDYKATVIEVPFNLNKTVSRAQFEKLNLIIKTVSSNEEKLNTTSNFIAYNAATRTYKAVFPIMDFTPNLGQFYKVQIAFIDAETQNVGYYSTVGVIKCTSMPTTLEIKNREETNVHTYSYTGFYSQENGDPTERVYSYCFTLYDESNNIVATSGEQIHNSSTDIDYYSSIDTWTTRKTLEKNVNYYLEYAVKTINGLEPTPCRYLIIDAETVQPNVHATLHSTIHPDDGYVDIYLSGDQTNTYINGFFKLLRSSSEDNFESWYEMCSFQLSLWDAHEQYKHLCYDFTVKQGIKYKYAIQAYNSKGLFSNRMIAVEDAILVDFVDAFLFDGKRQLKIRFNPKISSFKSIILESKTDTIGGKYPFIFRNGNVEYKEFQVSGLLSLLSDENNLFMTNLINKSTDTRTSTNALAAENFPDKCTDLTAENYYREREFKMQALEWLHNGKPKLFRSPGEGNYIVRLMNLSLTPNDTLGRMLHTFQGTAYEIAECSFENMQKYGFLTDSYIETRNLKINQIDLNNPPEHLTSKMQYSYVNSSGKVVTKEVLAIQIPEAYVASITADPDIDFLYTLAGGEVINATQSTNLTGTFVFPEEVLLDSPLTGLFLDPKEKNWGYKALLTYGYYDTAADDFSMIESINTVDKIEQIIGKGIGVNLIKDMEDIRLRTGAFHYLRVRTRFEKRLYDRTLTKAPTKFPYEIKYDLYEEGNLKFSAWNPTSVYEVYNSDGKFLYFIDGRNPSIGVSGFSYWFRLNNDDRVDFSGRDNTTGRFEALMNVSSIDTLCAGEGLILDVVYQLKTITYTIETENAAVKNAKDRWLEAQSIYNNYITVNNSSNSTALEYYQVMQNAYAVYINTLERALKALGEEYNIEYAI